MNSEAKFICIVLIVPILMFVLIVIGISISDATNCDRLAEQLYAIDSKIYVGLCELQFEEGTCWITQAKYIEQLVLEKEATK